MYNNIPEEPVAKTMRSVIVSSRMNHVFFKARKVCRQYAYVGVDNCMGHIHINLQSTQGGNPKPRQG